MQISAQIVNIPAALLKLFSIIMSLIRYVALSILTHSIAVLYY